MRRVWCKMYNNVVVVVVVAFVGGQRGNKHTHTNTQKPMNPLYTQ